MVRGLGAALAGLVIGVAGMYAVLDRDAETTGTADTTVSRDIGSVATLPAEVAAVHRENRYGDLRTVEQILALPSDFARTEALYMLAGRSNSGTLQNLIYEAIRIADPVARNVALGILFARLTELDPSSALAMTRTDAFSADRNMESEVWRNWGKFDLDAALAAAKLQASSGQRNRAAQALFAAFGYLGNKTTDRIENEVGIRPDRSARGRYLYELANRSPEDAFNYVNNIRSSREQRDNVRWLANHLARTDPDRAASYAILIEDANLQESYRNSVAATVAAAEPQHVLDRLLTSYQSDAERTQVHSAMAELVARDVESAMQYLQQVTSAQDRERFGHLIAEELARQDPARALAWARENDRGERRELTAIVLRQIATVDPQFAMQEVKNIRGASARQQALSSVIGSVARHDQRLAAEFVEQIESRQERDMAAGNLIWRWVRQDAEAAINWAMNSDKIDNKQTMAYAGRYLVRSDMDAAIRLLPKLDENTAADWRLQIAEQMARSASATAAQNFISQFDGSEDYSKLQAAIVRGVAKNDITLARQLADQLPAGKDKDFAYHQLVERMSETDPGQAANWLSTISDVQQRGAATKQLISNWYAQDPAAAGRWVDKLPRGPQRDDAIVGLASSWEEMTPSRTLLLDSIGSAEKQIHARFLRIAIVAKTDWQKAQTMLNNTELSSLMRQQMQSLIDNHRNR